MQWCFVDKTMCRKIPSPYTWRQSLQHCIFLLLECLFLFPKCLVSFCLSSSHSFTSSLLNLAALGGFWYFQSCQWTLSVGLSKRVFLSYSVFFWHLSKWVNVLATICFLFAFSEIFFNLRVGESESERERLIESLRLNIHSHLLVYSQNACKDRCWARPKPGDRNSV